MSLRLSKQLRLPLRPSSARTYATENRHTHGRNALRPRNASHCSERPPMTHGDPLTNSPNATTTTLPDNAVFIHRPPPSAPSPFSYTTNPVSPLLRPPAVSASTVDVPLPPPVKKGQVKEYQYLSDEDIEQMKELRAQNPNLWTRGKLAEKFNVSPIFVGQFARLSKGQKRVALEKRDKDHEKMRSRWGERKLIAKEIRSKRKEFW
ncbi:uncharacterized protein STEHIDRAFT_171956 [Stereum hirsutum FP-91666 SS1]|uniref:uncharacterized protein n=1 Tax=Stereum hirsutum (strain FP-91666) TaxID=721885 RepID=UPI000444A413|nr:uncharacterized protein STEHIDRAFT_171956 [Stereum hirsutum FP-91666 SS1]EIM81668.1 hypothetical protein STEHIDRAFT_171956 [Stereum hirsutum FP-91666 SS1]